MVTQHTKFAHLTDHELTRLVSSSECTQLEIELAQRLYDRAEECKELADAQKVLPALSSLQLHLLADCA